ncbi:MAG: serine O-acetyltransferase [Opitutales bacterium]|nr:serine O-acetyltransferase [Opitutales bacterium]
MKAIKSDEDFLWKQVSREAAEIAANEPELAALVKAAVLDRTSLFDCVAARISRKLGKNAVSADDLYAIFTEAFDADAKIRGDVVADLLAVKERDPACTSCITPILYYKGFQSITTHRVAHRLWNSGRKHLAQYLQSLSSEIFGVDIHPAAKFGGGIMLDHATSFVAGETSVVEDNVSILHEVTLGGTGNEIGDRHPKVKSGVLIGAGAKLIGNITIGECAKIGAGSVVLDDVPAHTTVAGVPAKPVGACKEDLPATDMNQRV